MSASQLRSSSSLAFARSLFYAAEGKGLCDGGFTFASAVSTYYSIFHLGGALILAYCSNPPSTDDRHSSIRNKLEEEWSKRRPSTLSDGRRYLADPAKDIFHKHVKEFLTQEIPEIGKLIGDYNQHGTLMDMRQFVSYAPRMVSDGPVNVLYSVCQYKAHDFQAFLSGHLRLIDETLCKAVAWLRGGCNETFSRILSGDFVLLEFAELGAYHPRLVANSAFKIYQLICDQEQVDWRIYRSEPGTWRVDKNLQQVRYARAIASYQ